MITALDAPITTGISNATITRPRLGFLGVGWIGRNRMEAIAQTGNAEIAAIADASSAMKAQALTIAPKATLVDSLDELLEQDLNGIVIATPSAMHAEQAIAAVNRGIAVFCQKPLARTGPETQQVIEAARNSNRLLGVDLSYRYVSGVPAMRNIIQSGELGDIYAVDMVFHNAYGPDKAWFYNPQLSGGGCVIDLGIHLVDLAFWSLGFPQVEQVSSRLFAQGKPLQTLATQVEDFATARLDLSSGAALQLSCSWKLQAGRDAIIRAAFYGSKGGIEFRNVNGSFYDFTVERFYGTRRETLAVPPDSWGGRAAVAWTAQLAKSPRYDPEVEGLIQVATALDQIYGR